MMAAFVRNPALLLAAALAGCDLMSTQVADGGGFETTNGTIAGAAVYGDGSKAAWSSIILRHADYLRDTSKAEREVVPDALADGSGAYFLKAVAPGAYTMEIRDGQGKAAIRSVTAAAGRHDTLSPDLLRPVGTVIGTLAGVPGSPLPGYARIVGLEQLVRADSTGRFRFNSLPLGRHRLQAVAAQPGWSYPELSINLISHMDTLDLGILALRNFTDEDYGQWSRSRKILIDAAAAGIADTLADFALLVRLDSSNFDFRESFGSDFRFSDPAGRHLAYEVEDYDATARRAAIWVRIDTLYGGTRDRFVRMHWGKTGVPDFSEGKRTFPEADGIWHLRGVTGKSSAFPDASPQANHGKGDAPPAPASAVGPGISVSGGRHVGLSDIPLFAPDAQVAFSAWFRSAATDSAGGEIASMGDNYGLRLREDGSLYFFLVDDSIWDPGEPINGGSWRLCILEGLGLVDDLWHHAAAVYDGAFMRIYLDGAEAAKFPYSGKIVYPFKGGFQIGRHGFGSHDKDFRGGLDEFRFSRRAWSAGLVKAEYENQKPGSVLLRFE